MDRKALRACAASNGEPISKSRISAGEVRGCPGVPDPGDNHVKVGIMVGNQGWGLIGWRRWNRPGKVGMPPAREAFRTPSYEDEQGFWTDNDMAIYRYAIPVPRFTLSWKRGCVQMAHSGVTMSDMSNKEA